MNEDRSLQVGAGLELGQQPVDVVDVPRPLDLRDHHDVEPVADLADELREVVEHPRRLERVHARPQRGLAELDRLPDLDQAGAGGLLAVDRDRVLEVAEQDVGLVATSAALATIFSLLKSRKWIIRLGRTGISRSGWGAPIASGWKNERGLRMAPDRRVPGPMSTSVDTDQRSREATGRTRTAAISRSSRSAPSTSTGRPRR